MDPALKSRQLPDRRSQDRRQSSSTGGRRHGERRHFDRRRAAAGVGLMAALVFGGVRAQHRLQDPSHDISSHTLQIPGFGPITAVAPDDGQGGGQAEEPSAGDAEEDSELARRRAALEPFIQAAAQEYGVDPDLVRAVVETESQYDAGARSGAGAVGAMQLMPRTARSIGIRDPLDPRENIFGGTKYLSTLLARFDGNTALALAGYNAGPTLVARHGRVPPIRETQDYVKKIHLLLADTDAAFQLPANTVAPRRASLRATRTKARASASSKAKVSARKPVKKKAAARTSSSRAASARRGRRA